MATPYPFYLEGTQTAGLFQQPAGTQAPTQYVPGSGMPLYAQTTATGIMPQTNQGGSVNTFSSLDEAIRAAAPYGQGAIDQAVANFNAQQAPTVVGQGEGWLTPDELRDRTNALRTRVGANTQPDNNNWGGSSNSRGNISGPAAGAASGGLLSGGAGSGGMGQMAGPNVGGFPGISTGGLTNYLPGGTSGGQVSGGPGSTQVGGGGPLSMMQAGPQNALNQYYNTPGYQLTEGSGAVNQFQTSPGYQFAVNEALGQVQRNAASRGLLDSGAALRAMTDRAQGMANQEFGNWQNRQQQMYGNYQDRLAGLAGGPTGAEMAYGLGQGMGANAMQTGGSIGSLLANQGNSLFGGIVGAGGAQAQNVTQAGNMQAQILGGNLATQLAAAVAGQRR